MKTLNYIGCKKSLCHTILKIVKECIPDMTTRTFMDMFAGTGIVSHVFKDHVKSVWGNDLEYYSFIILSAILKSRYSKKLERIISVLNETEPVEGLVYINYSEHAGRLFFTNENAKKIDAIRCMIKTMKQEKQITKMEHDFLLASLIISADKVANTSCVYGAFLKTFKSSSTKPIVIEPIHQNTKRNPMNKVFNKNAEQLVKTNVFDIVYMDPPYNQRQYSANYSPLNYIARYDESIKLRGKTGLIDKYNKSRFSKKGASGVFAEMINTIQARDIFVSYNNEGLLSEAELKDIFCSKGVVTLYKIPYKKFKNNQKSQSVKVCEYLWHIHVTDERGFKELDIEMEKKRV